MSQLLTNAPGQPLERWVRRYRARRERCTNSHVEVYVRSYAPAPGTHARRNCFFDRLDEATGETIDSYGTTVVGEAVCLCDRCRQHEHNHELRETVISLMSWKEDGLEASGFLRREINSTVTNERHEIVTPPVLAIGIYLDDSLAGVFPCRDSGEQHSPSAFLREVANGRFERGEEQDTSEVRSRSS